MHKGVCQTRLEGNETGFVGLFNAGILERSMGTKNRVGIELSYRPTKVRLAESIPWNRFLGPLKD